MTSKMESKNGVHRLKIKQARPRDSGTYVCKASNTAGSVKSEAKLTVKSMLKGTTSSKPISSIFKKFF